MKHVVRSQRRVLLLIIAVCLAGCSYAKAPMDVLYYHDRDGQQAATYFVFMRGMGGGHTVFAEEGLVDDVRGLDMAVDMAAPDAHFGYYLKRNLLERLKEDVIDPARLNGAENIWLVGFSMGGLGSLLYGREHGDHISGICLIAPFLGDDESLFAEIRQAGGVSQWQPGEYDPHEDYQRMVWHWLKENAASAQPLPIFLGVGRDDEVVAANRLLAEIIPTGQVVYLPGGHDYPTFKALWHHFLASGLYRQ